MRRMGYSTGAVAYGDFMGALDSLRPGHFECLELSALRVSELRPLIAALPHLDLSGYSYISIHAPSKFSPEEEPWISDMLYAHVPEKWPIIIHPDAISNYQHWIRFGQRLAIENMDRRKPAGRTVGELQTVFDNLPNASLCFDIGHARQCDTSMTQAFLILSRFSERLAQIHISEVNSQSQHDPISFGAKLAFRRVARLIPERVPVIIESRVLAAQLSTEADQANSALAP